MKRKIDFIFLKSFMLYIIVVIMFVTSVVGFIIIYENSVNEYNMKIYRSIGLECSKFTENKLNAYFETLEKFSKDVYINTEKPEDFIDEAPFRRLMEYESYIDMVIIEKNGRGHSVLYGEIDLKQRKYFQTAINGKSNISETIVNVFSGLSANVFAVPIYSDKNPNEITGVLAAVMSVEKFHDIIRDACESDEINNYIISSDGVILVSPKGNNPSLKQGQNLFDNSELKQGSLSLVRQALYTGNTGSVLLLGIDGKNYYTSYNKTNIGGWIILTLMPEDVINEYTSDSRKNVIMFTIICSIVSATLILYLVFKRWALIGKVNLLTRDNDLLKNVDPVTGFYGPAKFFEVAEETLKLSDHSKKYSMLSIDIDKFRMINDLHGHETGNSIITKLANVLNRNLGDDETFLHMSADLFYVLIKYENDEKTIERIKTIIDDASYQINECVLVLSVGVYIITDKSQFIRLMMDRADLARISAKNTNESSFSFFDPGLLIKIREEKLIECAMEQALESNEFKVYLQPKFDVNDGTKIVGAEALVRWLKNGELVPPGAFIPLFERNGFITKLDRFVFEEICKQQKIWLSRGFDMRVISVNMSRVNLHNINFVQDLYEISQRYNIPTKYFEIEITESVGYENIDVLVRVFNEIKNFGFFISIDDFGTGYSSLNMLKDLPVDVLKIDRTFLGDAGTNDRATRIIEHVISLATALKMHTICEGIETIEQVNLLSNLGCEMAQGYFFARPMPIPEYERLVYTKGNPIQ